MYISIVLCVLIVFSLHRESLKLILVNESLPKGVLSQLVSKQAWGNTQKFLKIKTMICQWGSFSPHKEYSSFLRWQANIFVHNTSSELSCQRYAVILVCYLFCCFWAYFVVCDFVELLGHVYASFLFIKIIWLFMFICRNLLVKSQLGGC
jgi:hypothetical protein